MVFEITVARYPGFGLAPRAVGVKIFRETARHLALFSTLLDDQNGNLFVPSVFVGKIFNFYYLAFPLPYVPDMKSIRQNREFAIPRSHVLDG